MEAVPEQHTSKTEPDGAAPMDVAVEEQGPHKSQQLYSLMIRWESCPALQASSARTVATAQGCWRLTLIACRQLQDDGLTDAASALAQATGVGKCLDAMPGWDIP